MVNFMEHLAQLYGVLQEESFLYEELLKLSKEKREILLNKKIGELPSITRKEGCLVEKISKLEDERIELLHEVAERGGVPVESVNLSKIIEIAPEGMGEQFTKLRATFRATLEELQRLNELNEGMITDSLSYIKLTLDTIRNTVESQHSTYGGQGKRKEGVGVPILINREA
jgi:flagellar biosynthesis/type III secretory pathway chaperone